MRRNALIATATLAVLLAFTALTGCSREKIDWKSAEAADTVEGYAHFIERHPDSALVTQARARVTQLNEDRDWKTATATDTAGAYREFLAQHESGKWAEEARIRIENFALDGTATGPAQPAADAAPAVVATPPAVAATPAATHGPRDTAVAPSAASSAKPAVVAAKSAAESKPSSAAKPAPEQKHLAAATPPAATAKPAAAPAATPPTQFGIQLGAFSTQDAALKNWKQLQTKYDSDLHGLFAHAVPVKQSAGQLFRLQAPVGEESRARAICASLSKQSQPCVVVLPQPQVSPPR